MKKHIPEDLKPLYRKAKLPLTVELIERIGRLERAIRWAQGEVDDFPMRKDGQGAYWWRTELRKRAGMDE
jgi:hypothetical protein